MSSFYLHTHPLAVESSCRRGENGHCDKGSCAAVHNEVHVLFHVKTSVCSQKNKSSLFSLFASLFLWRPLIFCMPCLVRLSLVFLLQGTTLHALLALLLTSSNSLPPLIYDGT